MAVINRWGSFNTADPPVYRVAPSHLASTCSPTAAASLGTECWREVYEPGATDYSFLLVQPKGIAFSAAMDLA